MPPSGSQSSQPVEWARRVNRRWIVHHGLQESAEAYLDHLQAVDHKRLALSCVRAQQLVRACSPAEDPKPWFYAGLFSLVSMREAEQFLKGHWFTASCIPSLPAEFGERMQPDGVGPSTKAKLKRLREALAKPHPARN